MAQIFKKCKNCENIMTIFNDNKTTICKNCSTEYNTSDLLDDEDQIFFKSLKNENYEISLKYNAFIIQGNENISMGLYEKAEECFKQAIELNENRYEGYYGIVRAKTHDFQVVPNTQDYIEYAKIAINIADDDIDPKINANLAKLNIFK